MSRRVQLVAFCGAFAMLSAASLTAGVPTLGQTSRNLWQDLPPQTETLADDDRGAVRGRTLLLDRLGLEVELLAAPREGSAVATFARTVIDLPLPAGGFGRFEVEESPIMAAELAARYPEIRTFRGFGIDDRSAFARFDLVPQGFHAIILSAGGTVYIDPLDRERDLYISRWKRDQQRSLEVGWECEFSQVNDPVLADLVPAAEVPGPERARMNGTELRTYRLAVAATGEYTQFHGGTVPLGLAAVVTAMNRVNGIYERDVALRMVLVPDNDQLIFTDPQEDPYTNRSGVVMLTQNQTTLDALIGNANYDIGHVFSTGGGGVASLGVPCVTGLKARGVTGLSQPINDPFWVDFVAHEMGHQWGATHTFNGTAGSCSGGNRTTATAYEPGSGSTIMAYAGICGSQNLQPNSDDHFHVASYDQILTYSQLGSGNSCALVTATGNTPPTSIVPAIAETTIPKSTPFELCGEASDPNHAGLTFGWEEYDLGPAGAPGSPTGTAPLFRSFSPGESPCRTFPRLEDLLANSSTIGELLPGYGRGLSFRLTVRDNMLSGGGADYDQLSLTVDAGSGPFLVTAPNAPTTWTGLVAETVTWDPAGTNGYCSHVDVLLSGDGGWSYPGVLLAGTPNDGSETVVAANAAVPDARIKVRCSDGVFFDVSDANFSIVENGAPAVTITAPLENQEFTAGSPISFVGAASDPEDGDRSAFIAWSSNIDAGALGAGGSPTASLSAGYHTVTAEVTDTVGQLDADEVHVAVSEAGCPANLLVSDDPPAGASVYSAVETVTVSPNVAVASAADVTIRAGRLVELEDAIEVAGTLTVENTPTPCPEDP